ncbi:uncharacterized protein [Leptinotarsa decemlineata]|uniref:uncharacterized protein n=1 Tax=Leptinotarsa decemlineata TaxID=7539 RepID=UPI003D30AF8B
MPWVIVKFCSSEEVEAVPYCWYNKTNSSILYPPFPKNRMEKAIRNELEPSKDWKEYKVSLMRDTVYDSSRVACAKATKCCISSDLSEVETLSDKRKCKKKMISSSEESDSDLDGIFTLAPKKGINNKRLDKNQENSSAQKTNINQDQEVDDTQRVLLTSDEKFQKSCIGFLVKNTKLIQDCERKLLELSEKMDDIITLLKDKPSISSETVDLFMEFPITDDLTLSRVEENLQNDDNFKRLVEGLCKIGGNDFKECSRRLLKRVIDDKFALGYSLHGHKHKKVFRNTRICTCIFDAVQRCHPNVTAKEIEVVVSAYLAKASERLRRQQGVNPPTEESS